MASVRKSKLKLSFWLTLSVLLLYQQTADMVLAMNTVKEIGQERDPLDPKCSDWEVFDGTDCACADDASITCSDQGGMVCDNMGLQYKSVCAYALATCNEKTPLERNIETCGFCQHLRLVAGQDSRVIETFSRSETQHDRYSAEYQSHNTDAAVFYSTELDAWVIGRRSNQGTFVAMRQVRSSTYPQDDRSGMLVATQQGDQVVWNIDPFMHFECVQNVTERHRHKRFWFVAFVFVGLAATTTTTTLKVVQSAKGCLYYPSVCKLRDRIRDHLKPEVTNLRDRFISTYGDPGQFKQRVDKIHDQTLEIRDKVTTLKELHSQIQLHLSNITVLSSSIRDDFPEFKNALSNYDGWVANLKQMASINIMMLKLEIVLTLPGLVATSVGSFALAAAGIGALVAVGFAVVDVVSSVKEEKKVRDQLRDTESKYLKAKADLDSAFSNVKQFQRKFCSSVIDFYRDLSRKGSTYHSTFKSLHASITSVYGSSEADCAHRYSRSNLATLTTLSNQYLQPLINVLANDIEELRRKITEMEETRIFLSEVTNMVKSDKESPTAIFRAIKASKPKVMSKTFNTLWDLLSFIAKQVLYETHCYWGYNLRDIRAESMNKNNFFKYSICNSVEMHSDVTKMKQGVDAGFAPCKIFRQVQGTVFRSKYSVIKFIADHILKTSNCFWGYDLENLRNEDSNENEIDSAVINTVLFQTLSYFMTGQINTDQISSARNILCSAHQVCSTAWQNFILCQTWKGHDVIHSLGCAVTENSSASSVCIPAITQNFESCN